MLTGFGNHAFFDILKQMKTNLVRGFTIIELLVVISIIGLLSSVVLAAMQEARAKARDAQRIQAMNELHKALFFYYDANGEYPKPSSGTACTNPVTNSIQCTSFNNWDSPAGGTTLASLLAPYLPSMPVDPAQTLQQHNTYNLIYTNGASARYGYGYSVEINGSEYDLITRLESTGNPLRCGVMQYISKRGNDTLGTNAGDEWCELESGGGAPSNIDATQQLYALSNSY